MKRTIAILLTTLTMLGLTACSGGNDAGSTQITVAATQPTEAAVQATAPAETTTPAAGSKTPFVFLWEGHSAIPGQPFDAAQWPEAKSLYQVPSCAVEGTDNVYNFGGFEITAFASNGSEQIYSVYITDPELTTVEGLALGDAAEKVTELYGDGYEMDGTAMVYTAANTKLIIILENNHVSSIEYRWVP